MGREGKPVLCGDGGRKGVTGGEKGRQCFVGVGGERGRNERERGKKWGENRRMERGGD